MTQQEKLEGLTFQNQPQNHFRDIYYQPLKAITEAIFMLGPWRTHAQFQEQLEKQLDELLPQSENQVKYHAGALE